MSSKKLLAAAAGSSSNEPAYVEDVFGITLHYGNGTSLPVTTGVSIGYVTDVDYVVHEEAVDRVALNTSYTATAGDILVVYICNAFGTNPPTLTVAGASITASTSLTDSNNYNHAVFITSLSAGANTIVSSDPSNGYVHMLVLRGPSSVTVGQALTQTNVTSITTTSFSSVGVGLALFSNREPTSAPSTPDSYQVGSFTATYFASDFITYAGNGTSVPAKTFTGLASSTGAYCVLNVVGVGSIVPVTTTGNKGMLWVRRRTTEPVVVLDSERGSFYQFATNASSASTYIPTGVQFTNDGFIVGSSSIVNASSVPHVSWAFKAAPKFFDVVEYTGTGSAATINHSLGAVPGMIIVKRADTTGDWWVYHKDVGATQYLRLNGTSLPTVSSTAWNDTVPTASVFSVGTASEVNASGGSYMAYLFAHDAGGFGNDNAKSIIACGSYTGNGLVNGPTISLGWEPQLVLIKQYSGAINSWILFDNLRGITAYTTASGRIAVEGAASESASLTIQLSPDGFSIVTTAAEANASGASYMYLAIRRGPMKVPESGIEVFSPTAYTSTNVDGRLVDNGLRTDMVITRPRALASQANYSVLIADRLRGNLFWGPISSTTSGDGDTFMPPSIGLRNPFDANVGYGVGNDVTYDLNYSTQTVISWAFRRAPEVFDMLTYSGTGTQQSIKHNLGVVPELIIVKRLQTDTSTPVYVSHVGAGNFLALGSENAAAAGSATWDNTTPTDSVFYVNNDTATNASGGTFVAYLFASLPGISKIGTYTGNGSSQTIDCGFSNGARLFIVKRTDDLGDWYIYDSARGIASGNDPQLRINRTATEDTAFDAVDPDSSGIIVNNDATNFPINVSGATYIYFAMA